MRFIVLAVSLILFLVSPACERTNPLVDQHDAGPVQPLDDAGTAMLDARTPRPGAGPLDPDLIIACNESAIRVLQHRNTGMLVSRTAYFLAFWLETELPRETWLCRQTPTETPPPCADDENYLCSTEGNLTVQAKCNTTLWNVTAEGEFYAFCGYWSEIDSNQDGVLERYGDRAGDLYLAVIR